MRSARISRPVFLCLALLPSSTARPDEVDAEGRVMLLLARKAVDAYHAGAARSGAKVRVVYFVPDGGEPLANHAERLDRVMADVSDFYRDGLRRLGLESAGLPVEREGGKLVLHLVRGKKPASHYNYLSGGAVRAEVAEALRGQVDLDREFVLIFYALCREEPDGRLVFDAPYYGGGTEKDGLCHAADCKWLDPALLRETTRKIVYTEHYHPLVQESIAEFNSKYLGGVAHELGHGLSLEHDAGSGPELRFGVSLMGVGNLHYRRDVWNGGPTAYLARASALKLVSHPLVTGSDRGRWEATAGGFESLRATARPGNLRIEATVTGSIPAYAVVAYAWPASASSDHHARTFPVGLDDRGSFGLDLDGLRPDAYSLKLNAFHANGATTSREFALKFDANGKPDADALNGDWLVRRAEEALMDNRPEARRLLDDRAIASAPTPESSSKLRVLRSIVDPPMPVDLAALTGDRAFLSDAAWTDARVGWGRVARNSFRLDDGNRVGLLLQLQGRFFEKGLYAHSPSRYTFPVAGKWKTFRGAVGLRDGADAQGSAVFIVLGDGRELFRSSPLRAGLRGDLTVQIAGVKELELRTEGGEGHNSSSWAIWVEPRVER